MGAIKNYFKQQFNTSMLLLEHESASVFYLSSFQRSQSALPSMLIRGILFLGSLSILLTSIIITTIHGFGPYWPIFLTHWGLVFITVASGFGFAVAAKAYIQGPIDATFGLPWYIKVYWAIYNIAIPLALFITVFYWIFLSNAVEDFAVNFTLDVFIHAVNSVLMVVLLLTARHPTNALHFYFIIILAVVYIVFTAIYYASGGTDPLGNPYIYFVLDWSNPGSTIVMLILSIVLTIVIHFILVIVTIGRDAFGRSCRTENTFVIAS